MRNRTNITLLQAANLLACHLGKIATSSMRDTSAPDATLDNATSYITAQGTEEQIELLESRLARMEGEPEEMERRIVMAYRAMIGTDRMGVTFHSRLQQVWDQAKNNIGNLQIVHSLSTSIVRAGEVNVGGTVYEWASPVEEHGGAFDLLTRYFDSDESALVAQIADYIREHIRINCKDYEISKAPEHGANSDARVTKRPKIQK